MITGSRTRESAMLRITVHDHPGTLTLQLEGSLAGPWVRVLEECWQTTVTGRRVRSLLLVRVSRF